MIMFWQKTGYFPVLGLLLVLYLKGMRAYEKDDICKLSDPGTLSNCTGHTEFEVNWNPQNITGDQEYYVTIKRLDIPEGAVFDSGSAHIIIWIPNGRTGHHIQLFNKTLPFKCQDALDFIHQQFPNITDPFSCPINKPFHLPFPYHIPTPFKTPAELPVPMGSYNVSVELFNAEEVTPFVCLEGWLIFSNVHKDYESCTMSPEANVDPETLQFESENEYSAFRKDQL